jgi:hypothetical protein
MNDSHCLTLVDSELYEIVRVVEGMDKPPRSLCYGDKDCPHAKWDGATWRCGFTEYCCWRDVDISESSRTDAMEAIAPFTDPPMTGWDFARQLECELADASAMLKVVSDQRDAALTLSAFRSALVRHDVIPPESIEDAEGYDGGRTMEATRLAFEELTENAAANKEAT